jgi:HD-GYP domain-containing protein (c-di-GMP phosphodiesterase class II)
MEETPKTVVKERIVATFLVLLGFLSLLTALSTTSPYKIRSQELLLAFLFTGAIILADRFPIHILRGTKLALINLPIYLLTVLLPAPLAILATGTGLSISHTMASKERGLLPRDILSTAGQWMFTVFLGNCIIHTTFIGNHVRASRYVLLLLCVCAFLLVDFLMFSLSQTFIFGEPFLAVLKSVFKEGFAIEIIQYLIAILGTLAADEDIWSLILITVPISITYVAFKNVKEIRSETVQILEDMADTVDLRDVYTGGHSKRVAALVSQTLRELHIAGPEATLIETSARLHDIGKIGIPDEILMKPSRLLSDETTVMHTHSQKGAELISKYKDFARGAMMILHHHESWDGSGYPDGLKGYEIPFGARVIAVADSYDAIISDRPYRDALSSEQALQILLQGRGKQWDTNIINAFVDMITRQIDENRQAITCQQDISQELPSPVSVISQPSRLLHQLATPCPIGED